MEGTSLPHERPDSKAERARADAAAKIPVIWLFGKTQAGKTSIAVALTGTGAEGIGLGFQRTTTEPTLLPWPPPPEPPILLFLDTPGIGAPEADAEAEAKRAMAQAEDQAHLILVAVRVEDRNTGALLRALNTVRARHPEWPVVVAQTRLHDLYPAGMGHILPYPFKGNAGDETIPGLPYDLARALQDQRRAFAAIAGPPPVFVPIDVTREAQDLPPRGYGAEALLDAIARMVPETAAVLRTIHDPLKGARSRIILPWALAAAASEAPPLPFIGLAGATTFQGWMLRAIARRCGLVWERGLIWRFLAVLGPGILVSTGTTAGLRQVVKLIPGAGTAAAAAAAFGVTWAAGEAAMVMFTALGHGAQPDAKAVRDAWQNGFKEAADWWRRNHSN